MLRRPLSSFIINPITRRLHSLCCRCFDHLQDSLDVLECCRGGIFTFVLKCKTDVAVVFSSLANVCVVEERLEAEDMDDEWLNLEYVASLLCFEIDVVSLVGRLSAFQFIRRFLCAFCFVALVAELVF